MCYAVDEFSETFENVPVTDEFTIQQVYSINFAIEY